MAIGQIYQQDGHVVAGPSGSSVDIGQAGCCCGACCHEDESCTRETFQDCIATEGNLWVGGPCEANTCSGGPPGPGACCDGNAECTTDVLPADCDGIFHPDNICEPTPCGRCCFPTVPLTCADAQSCIDGGTCYKKNDCEIHGGSWKAGATCLTSPCEGACCSGALCVITDSNDCGIVFDPCDSFGCDNFDECGQGCGFVFNVACDYLGAGTNPCCPEGITQPSCTSCCFDAGGCYAHFGDPCDSVDVCCDDVTTNCIFVPPGTECGPGNTTYHGYSVPTCCGRCGCP